MVREVHGTLHIRWDGAKLAEAAEALRRREEECAADPVCYRARAEALQKQMESIAVSVMLADALLGRKTLRGTV